jgi:hypothetical protein
VQLQLFQEGVEYHKKVKSRVAIIFNEKKIASLFITIFQKNTSSTRECFIKDQFEYLGFMFAAWNQFSGQLYGKCHCMETCEEFWPN